MKKHKKERGLEALFFRIFVAKANIVARIRGGLAKWKESGVDGRVENVKRKRDKIGGRKTKEGEIGGRYVY